MIFAFAILFFFKSTFGFSEECVELPNFGVAKAYTILCSKLYHGIWAIPLANPVLSIGGAQPCNTPCLDYDQCELVNSCIAGTDGVCVFSNTQLSAGVRTNCPGSHFQMYYVCLPLKNFIKDVCYGLPSKYCYSDDFRTSGEKKWTRADQVACSAPCQLDQLSNSNAYKDKLVFNARHTSGRFPAGPGLALVVTDPNAPLWRNYEVTANYYVTRLNGAEFNVFVAEQTQMVGIIVRQRGNALSGGHYMAAWRGSSDGVTSPVGLFEWTGTAYTMLASATTAPMPANFWFSMIVRVVGQNIKIFTNKSPLGEPTSQCSQRVNTTVDPVNCNGNQLALEFSVTKTVENVKGSAGLYFAGSAGYSDDLYVRRIATIGTCGNGMCEEKEDEDCINCPADCIPPCGCGDGVCAGDSEALGCVDDCLNKCQVSYYNKEKRIWFYRPDAVAAYYSFDNQTLLGHDDADNGVDLSEVTVFGNGLTTGCAPVNPASPRQTFSSKTPGCLKTTQYAPLFLKEESSAWGRLPVSSCDFTVSAFVKMTESSMGSQQAFLFRWGDDSRTRSGMATKLLMNFGIQGDGRDGSVTFVVGLHTHTTAVNWAKPGLRYIAVVYVGRGDKIKTQIYIDDAAPVEKSPCSGANQRQAAQMVTFGKLELADFTGIVDDLKIVSTALGPERIVADRVGTTDFVKTPDGVYATGAPGSTPPDFRQLEMMLGATTSAGPPTPSTTAPDPTLGPQWPRGQTAPVQKCTELCAKICMEQGKKWVFCPCKSQYAIPQEPTCPASHIVISSLSILSSLVLLFFV